MTVPRSRLAGVGFLIGAVVVFLAAYGWLIGARAEHLINQTAFAAGLLIVLLAVLPIMTFGVYLAVHGVPSPEEARRRVAMDRLWSELESDGWADVFAVIDTANVRRGTVRHWLAEELGSRRATGYVDWRTGTLVRAMLNPGTCPNCGGPVESDVDATAAGPNPPENDTVGDTAGRTGNDATPVQCPACRVDVFGLMRHGVRDP